MVCLAQIPTFCIEFLSSGHIVGARVPQGLVRLWLRSTFVAYFQSFPSTSTLPPFTGAPSLTYSGYGNIVPARFEEYIVPIFFLLLHLYAALVYWSTVTLPSIGYVDIYDPFEMEAYLIETLALTSSSFGVAAKVQFSIGE